MWDNKLKAVTFSFDDGVFQDIRLVKLLNEYNIKATFNLNSGIFSKVEYRKNKGYVSSRLPEDYINTLYQGHEIASHTLTHPHLNELNENEIINEINRDVNNLEKLTNAKVVGFAYPFGLSNERIEKEIIKNQTNIKYARTTKSTYSFDIPSDLYELNPTVHFKDKNIFKIINDFINLKTDKPQLLYIWGHSYELDLDDSFTWDDFIKELKLISNHDDIYYDTNSKCLLKN